MLQKYESAIDQFDQAIKIDPKYVYAYNNKGLNINNIIINRIFAL